MSRDGVRRMVLSVERGRAKVATQVFDEGRASERVSVGSSGLCDWRVHARGVRAEHFRLVWTGRGLRVEVLHGAGSVAIDGHPISHRFDLPLTARIAFGDAIIQARSQDAAPRERVAVSERRASSLSVDTAVDVEPPPEVPVLADSWEPRSSMTLAAPPAEDGGGLAIEAEPSTERRQPRRRARASRRAMIAVGGAALSAGVVLAALGVRVGAIDSDGIDGAGRAQAHAAGSGVASAAPSIGAPDAPTDGVRLIEAVGSEGGADAGVVPPDEAALLLVRGLRVEALDAFRHLARREPDDERYADVVRLLARQLRDRCTTEGDPKACDAL